MNKIYYYWRRNNWIFNPTYNLERNAVPINKPIFLLGIHGGGLTLVSRMLRRNKDVVSVSGNYKYWSGADEMQVVYGLILPSELAGIRHKIPYHPEYGKPRGWIYACDEMISKYRKTEKDANLELSEKLKKIIKWTLERHALDIEKARFIDKSQVYTVKVSFIGELLKGCSPKFILVTRNPYALCYRSAKGKAGGLKKMIGKLSFKERLIIASQHWTNSIKYALEDSKKVESFMTMRFEDVLCNPKESLAKLCDFAELSFSDDMLPQPNQKIPLGTRFVERWYPLNSKVNYSYLKELKDEYYDIIHRYCGDLANHLGYSRKGDFGES
ncbi:MAG: sulfotransferase [Candidatus Helarchaeota archaeon]